MKHKIKVCIVKIKRKHIRKLKKCTSKSIAFEIENFRVFTA